MQDQSRAETATCTSDLLTRFLEGRADLRAHAPTVTIAPTATHVTFFSDFSAQELTTEQLTLVDLRERVLNASKRKKAKLPWLKLAVFGKKRSEKNCLRHDANVEQISGIEIDCDTGKISFDAVLDALKALKVRSLLYTSPSHSADNPRWRIVAPTSQLLSPEIRKSLVARLNGALMVKLNAEKIAATESFALSQSYYYGWIMNKLGLDHRAEVIEGGYIDRRDDLAEHEARGQVHSASADDKATNPKNDTRGFENILATMGDGDGLEGFHIPLLRAAASYVALHRGNPFDKEKLKELLRAAIDKAPKKDTPERAKEIEEYKSDKELDGLITSAQQKYVADRQLTVNDFVAVMSKGNYLFIPTREMWPSKSVNTVTPAVPLTKPDGTPVLDKKKKPVLLPAATWLDQHHRVEQISWVPSEAEIIRDRLLHDGGWIERLGVSIFNLYRPGILRIDDLGPVTESDIGPWLNHLKAIYPDDHQHIIKWLAHRVQRPGEKINHALLLGGAQGVGKDSILEPVKYAIGHWNFQEVTPATMLGSFNGFLRAVILRINEARDLGDINRYTFYDHLKIICAAPPDVLRVNEKNLREHYIFNACGVLITTNYKSGGLYLPADDRRTYVAWTNAAKEQFADDYWQKLWGWYVNNDGIRKVAKFLSSFDLSSFNPKAPPPLTPAFFEIVSSGIAPEEIELADLIERMGSPKVLTISQLANRANTEGDLEELADWLDTRANRKTIPHKLEQCGYVRCPNPNNKKQGIWIVKGWHKQTHSTEPPKPVEQRQHIYAKASLTYNEQVRAVRKAIKQWQNADETAKQEAEFAARARRFDFNRA